MRKRRVGVTARSRQNEGGRVTGILEFVTEMAAPLELRTPAGTCGGSCKESADGSMATRRGESTGRRTIPGEPCEGRRRATRARSAHEALPHTPSGGRPPETPAPFPSGLRFQNGGNPSRVRKPRRSGAPLTDSLRSEGKAEMRERGLVAKQPAAMEGGDGETARYARMRRCLILRQGASPLKPPAPRKLFS